MYTKFDGYVYSVGDGFCYEGIIRNNHSKYHFVIDCGSQEPKKSKQKKGELSYQIDCNTRLKEISDEIVNNDKHIDLFILTHLHIDHYNGMKILFNSGIPDTIIMPYLYPEERLYLIMKNDLDEEDIDFLTSPYDRILELAKKKNPNAKLILIRGNIYDDEINPDEINPDEINSNEPISWGRKYEGEENILEIENLNLLHAKVVYSTSKGVKIPGCIWMFKFFNLEADKNEVEILKKISGNLTAKSLYSKINNPTELKKIKKQYDCISIKFYNDFNNTSIVTYHAPIKVHNRCGTLITGDIDLNHGIVDLMLNYFKNELDKIGLFSIPHHGSDKNWNKTLIENGTLDGSVCFASTHNYYLNRMTAIMMSDLRCQNISVLVVDENRFSEFRYVIWVCSNFSHDYIIKKNHHKLIEIYT